MKDTLVLSRKEIWQVLYYETGFEQLHPRPDVRDWMTLQGYEYRVDWFVDHHPAIDHGDVPYYYIMFKNNDILTAFSLRWLLKDGH